MTDHIPVIETDRLILRAPKLADLPAMMAFYASPQSHTVGGPRDDLASAMTLQANIGHWAVHGFGSWHIADKSDDSWLGRTGFLMFPGWEEPELGWAVVQEAQGKGIAREATLAARNYGTRHLGLNAVISYIRPSNTRSIAFAERLGAVLEKTHDNWRGDACHIYRHPKEAA